MKWLKWTAGGVSLLLGGALIVLLSLRKTPTPLRSTWAPALELLGEPAKSAGAAIGRILPIDDKDEKEYGDLLSAEYAIYTNSADGSSIYVNSLIAGISRLASKPFRYRVALIPDGIPNAFALPGGLILVTRGLVETLETEAQLVSVLAHEMGHIECGHCIKLVRNEVLARKLDIPEAGRFVDFLNNLFFRHSYSKTEEAEADAFAYRIILRTSYSPSSVAGAFDRLLLCEGSWTEHDPKDEEADILRDYIMSHPPLLLRKARYEAEAKRWWARHPGQRRYCGHKNLSERVPMSARIWDEEWVTSAQPRSRLR
jgi:predicted Zn-dependent protease